MRISIIGSGNVAGILGISLEHSGHKIAEVHSRNATTGRKLAKTLHAHYVAELKSLNHDADLFILAVDDDSIPDVVKMFPFTDKAVIHTSGITALAALKRFAGHGVFYPLNTFSHQQMNLEGSAVLVESSGARLLTKLKSLAKDLKCKALSVSTEDRMAVHLAAVFSNNFSNALFEIAYEILKKRNIPFSVLKPLIGSTVDKAFRDQPSKMQTGPAVRGDKKTMQQHLKLLGNDREAADIYKKLSALIEKQKKH